MRKHGSIQGYVITEFTDINWEANGLMDMWRRPKAYAEALADIQQPDVLLIESAKRNVIDGETADVVVRLSRFSATDPAGAVLKWTSDDESGKRVGIVKGGVAEVRAGIARGEVGEIARFQVTAGGGRPNAVATATLERLVFTLETKGGDVIAKNTHDLYVYPRPAEPPAGITLHDPNGGLTKLPWKAATASGTGTVVASVFDPQVRRHVEAGGTALVIASRVLFALVEAPGLRLVERRGEMDGNWVSNFPWMHVESPAFQGVGLTRISGFEARAATPRALIAGVPEESWRQGDVLSGMFFGWINENHATTVQFKLGKGKVVFTTFDASSYGTDPFTTHLVNKLVSYVGSDACAPVGELR
jgi:hypothetical protein